MRWEGLSSLMKPSVIKNAKRASAKGVKGNLKGEGRLLGGLLVVGGDGVAFEHREAVFGDHSSMDDIMAAVDSVSTVSEASGNAAFVFQRAVSPVYRGVITLNKHEVLTQAGVADNTCLPQVIMRQPRWLPPPALAVRGGGGEVRQVATKAELEQILSDSGDALVVVDFTATWCSPCQKIAPEFEQLSQELTDVVFLKVDVDENEETAQKYEVFQMPTFLFMRKGEVVEQFSGANIAVLRQRIDRLS
eukprot:g7439.t1